MQYSLQLEDIDEEVEEGLEKADGDEAAPFPMLLKATLQLQNLVLLLRANATDGDQPFSCFSCSCPS